MAVFAPDPRRQRWIATELERCSMHNRVCESFGDLVALLADVNTPRPPILVADFDALGAGELFALGSLRERGWFGSIIAIGKVSTPLVESLSIDRVLRPPLYEDLLCDAIDSLGMHDVTTPIPVVTAPG